MQKRIAIQGYEGSFHQAAARLFFGKAIEIIPCAGFREVVKIAADENISDGGVMAIENSIAGSILPNYNLLQKSKLKVTGEIYLHIKQHLLANPGVRLEDIREVHSHPMAILQCIEYLEKNPQWKILETEDTALSAKNIHQHHHQHAAAIAGKEAADLYGLDILVPDIHTAKTNYTRFLVLQREEVYRPGQNANKASVNFQTDHTKGSLAKLLTKIAEGDINLSKLQSFPIPGSDWKYNFHADMEFDSPEKFHRVIETIKPLTVELTIYGIYKNGKNG